MRIEDVARLMDFCQHWFVVGCEAARAGDRKAHAIAMVNHSLAFAFLADAHARGAYTATP